MIDREILGKYINFDNSCFTRTEKEEVRDLLYEYKDEFSLRDEIGICPNIEAEIDITDKIPFLIGHSMPKRKIKLSMDVSHFVFCI